jgi:RNA polymerase sigma-70 factor (ECF subfamily)
VQTDRHAEFLTHYTRAQLALRRFVTAHVPDFHEAEDTLQKVALVLWRKYGEFTGAGSFEAWAFDVARKEVLHTRRSSARRRTVLVGDAADMFAERLLTASTRLDERRGHLARCMEKLPENARKAVVARYERGASARELARSTGHSETALRAFMYRIRKTLARCMQMAASPRIETEHVP